MRVERVSYEVPTPSAVRGMIEAIFWKPEFRWIVHEIQVLAPVRYLGFRRNEVQGTVPMNKVGGWMKNPATAGFQEAGAGSGGATPRATLALQDVGYLITAEPRLYEPWGENTPRKYSEMFSHRVEKGQCFRRPAMGCREFAADFCLPDGSETPIRDTRPLGRMLYDISYPASLEKGEENRHSPIFFDARLVDGTMRTTPEDRAVLPDESYQALWGGETNAA